MRIFTFLGLCVAWAATACQADDSRPSLLDTPRVLAVRTDPVALPAGGVGVVEVLAHDATQVQWRGCATPWTADADPACRTGAWPLGAGASVNVAVPAGLGTLYLRIDANGPNGPAPPAVARWSAFASGTNHPVQVTAVETGQLLDAASAGGRLVLRAASATAANVEQTRTWYATAGDFLPWRTRGATPTTWSAPAQAGKAVLVCVSRDGLGGVGWSKWDLNVGAMRQAGAP